MVSQRSHSADENSLWNLICAAAKINKWNSVFITFSALYPLITEIIFSVQFDIIPLVKLHNVFSDFATDDRERIVTSNFAGFPSWILNPSRKYPTGMQQNRVDQKEERKREALWKLVKTIIRFIFWMHKTFPTLRLSQLSFGNFSYLDFFLHSSPTRIASEMFSTFSCQNNPQLALSLSQSTRFDE